MAKLLRRSVGRPSIRSKSGDKARHVTVTHILYIQLHVYQVYLRIEITVDLFLATFSGYFSYFPLLQNPV